MIKLDNAFLDSLGLSALPEQEKTQFLNYIYQVLQRNVGETLAKSMTEQQMDEFEGFVPTPENPFPTHAVTWLNTYSPNWRSDQQYLTLVQQINAVGASRGMLPEQIEAQVVSQHAAKVWLEKNFPSYKDVVNAELERLKQEISLAAPQILAASQQQQNQQN